jgi:hypothetical protein
VKRTCPRERSHISFDHSWHLSVGQSDSEKQSEAGRKEGREEGCGGQLTRLQ